jgi:hypothetical protein
MPYISKNGSHLAVHAGLTAAGQHHAPPGLQHCQACHGQGTQHLSQPCLPASSEPSLRVPLDPRRTTHSMVGAVTGVGLLEGRRGFNWMLLLKFFAGWVATLVIAAGTSAAFTAQASPCGLRDGRRVFLTRLRHACSQGGSRMCVAGSLACQGGEENPSQQPLPLPTTPCSAAVQHSIHSSACSTACMGEWFAHPLPPPHGVHALTWLRS